MEDHSSRFAATLADAARPAPPTDGSPHSALLIADPAFNPRQNPTLQRLEGAQAEVDAIRKMYPESVVLDSSNATRDSLIRLAPGASLIHYAGHALFDDARPEQSALVLAGTGRLTAEAVNSLQLRNVRLVVLSACSTARSRGGRSGGFAGFSGALLAAGVGGVMGSLWEADDSLTLPLMLEFHRRYREKSDPAEALREAQLHMLHLSDPALKSPAAWASFRYIGN
jgi:CHAT domain-containing protein